MQMYKNIESIYWDSNWNQLQGLKEEGEALEFKYEDENGKIIYPFIKRKTNLVDGKEYYDLVTARGQGGPRVLEVTGDKDKLIKIFDKKFVEYCNQERIIAEYIRFDPWISNYEDFSSLYNVLSDDNNVYCNDLTEDFFMMQYSSSVRNKVRKAENSGLKIEFDFEGKTIKEFLNLYNFTAEKYDITDFYKLDENFIKEYFNRLQDKVFIANAYYNDEIISSGMFLIGKDIVHFHFSSTNPEYRSLQPNTYLLYKVELYAQKLGKKLFDFGRASRGSSLEKFKFDFIHEKEERLYKYVVGTRILNQEIYDKLVEQRGGKHEGYFPEYR